ncbi:hypothetical protein [Thermoleptolyngbya sp.]
MPATLPPLGRGLDLWRDGRSPALAAAETLPSRGAAIARATRGPQSPAALLSAKTAPATPTPAVSSLSRWDGWGSRQTAPTQSIRLLAGAIAEAASLGYFGQTRLLCLVLPWRSPLTECLQCSSRLPATPFP